LFTHTSGSFVHVVGVIDVDVEVAVELFGNVAASNTAIAATNR